MSSVATFSMCVCTTVNLVHPLKLGVDQEKNLGKKTKVMTEEPQTVDLQTLKVTMEEAILLNELISYLSLTMSKGGIGDNKEDICTILKYSTTANFAD
ncbi:hypothetical protein DUI87_08344 [Hirundo rustica rustica]|uniref:Uncharacterized protein n=1 Tax=Hirundo rustica rustica TaxID=333673 RepID=A0A3M0KS60_HIRRU|nr:hypothetical protein DUI87_08344 [Hirundo rustica rustica]